MADRRLTDDFLCQPCYLTVVYMVFRQRKLLSNECLLEQV